MQGQAVRIQMLVPLLGNDCLPFTEFIPALESIVPKNRGVMITFLWNG